MEELIYSDGTSLEEGNYFIVTITNDEEQPSPLMALKFDNNAIHKNITAVDIKLEEKYQIEHYAKGQIPLLFMYLGNNEVIELLTKRKMPVIFRNTSLELNNNFFENSTEYESIIKSLVFFSPYNTAIYRVKNNYKLEYFNLITKYGPKLEMNIQSIFKNIEDEFKQKYQEVIENEIYNIAAVDNMMYDLDKELEDKSKVKIKK